MARQGGTRRRDPREQDGAVRLAGVVRRSRRGLLLGTALQATAALVLVLPARAQLAPNARPMGGVVVGGAASISRTPGATNIDQSSQRAAVNWQSFDVGAKQAVNFQQPNAAAVVLNRVTGPNPSQIAGQINANGQVILENQDGITFLKGAQINTAGLVATAAGITTKNFMAGHMVFDQPAAPNAAVVNEGRITVRQAGIAALVAPQVANSGVISAKLGRVVLAGAETATLDLYGDGLVSIDVNGEVKQVPVGPDGKPVTALVTNTGTIIAAGGQVLLTARQAAGLVQNLVVAGGTIAAPTAGAQTGQIVLNGIGGSLVVAGALLAQGNRAGQTGGQIEVAPSGGVSLAATARVDASGVAGGGTVAIGTDPARAAGGPSVTPTALSQDVTVAKGAVIAANATGKGNGGRITVLSAASTVMEGAIAARGGPQGGDGGFVEVSGQTLGFDGSVDVGAPAGNLGTILFDPGTLDIVSGTSIGSGTLDGTLTTNPAGTILASVDGSNSDTVSNFAIQSAGASGNVILQAATLLDVQASVSVTNSLTMQSGGDLLVDAGVSVQAGGTLSLGAGYVFPAGSVGAPGSIALGTSSGAAVALTAPTVILQGGTSGGGIVLNKAVIDASSVLDVSTGAGGVSQAGTGTIVAGTLHSGHGIAGSVNLAGGNTIAAIGSLVVTGGDFALQDAGAPTLTVTGSLAANNVTLAGATGLVLPGTISAPGGIVDLSTGSGGIRQPGSGVVVAGTFQSSGTIGGAVTLAGTANAIAALGALPLTTPTTSDFFLVDTGLLNAGAALAADHLSLNAGTIDVTGSLSGAAQVLLSAGGVTLGAGGTLAAPLVGLRADTIVAAAGSIQSVSTLEVAPATSGGTITLNGPASSSLDLDALLGAGESLLRIGAVTPAGGSAATTVAGSIAVNGSFGVSAVNLELDANGPITEGASGALTAATLTGLVNGGSVVLGGANTVGTLGAFGVTGGDFSLAEMAGQTLTVGGSVSAAGHRLTLGADGLVFGSAGSLVAATVALAPVTSGTTVTLGSGGAAFDVPASAFAQINAGRVDIGSLDGGTHVAAGAISITAGVSVGPGTTLGLYANGTIVEPGGSLLAAGLVGYAGLGADLTAGNSIAAIGSFGIGVGQTLALNDVATDVALNANDGFQNLVLTDPGGTVTIAGALSGQNITIDPAVIDVASSMSVAAGGTIALDAGTIGTPGTIILESTSTLLAAGASVELSTVGPGGGGVTQASGGTIVAGTLFSAGGVSGGVDLVGSNTIAALGSFAVPDGDFVLADGGETGALTLASTLTANNVTLGGAIGAPGSIVLNGGTIALNSGGTAVTLGAGAGGITLAGTALVNAGTTGTLALGTGAGGITQSGSAIIVAGILRGEGTVGGAVALGGANTIATLGSFTVSGADFTLADGGETGVLSVAGPVSAADVTIGGGTLSPGTLTVAGDITATGSLLSLGARTGGITIGGSLNASGTLALGAAGGGVAETGTIVAGTLASLGTVVGTANLIGSNTIGAIGNFAVSGGDFVLADAGEAAGTLAVPGMLVANNVTLGAGSTVPGAIAITGTVGVNGAPGTVVLVVGTGGIALAGSGLLGYGPGGLVTVDLTTAGGGITEAGSARLSAATLQSTGSVVGTVDLAGTTNAIGQINNFVVSGGDLILIEQANQSLTVAGSVSAAGHTIGLGTDGLVMGGSGSLVAATVAIAPVSSAGTLVTLGSAGGSAGSGLVLSAADFAQITAGTIDIGQLASGATIASAISIASGIAIPGTTTLGLFAAGGVVEAGGSIVGGGSLMGQAGSFALAGGNTIAALGPIVSARGFTLNDSGALAVVGAIQAGSVGTAGAVSIVDAGALSLDAGIAATVGSAMTTGVSLVATGTSNGIAQNSGTITTDGAVTLAASGTLRQSAGAAILASGGTIGLSGPTGIVLAGSVAAAANNVFVQAGTGAGVILAATGTLSAGGAGSQLLVQGDTLTVASGAALLATSGTVAIAPTSAIETSFGTTTPGLQLGPTVAAAISAAELRIGGYADPSGANQVTASGISLDQSVDLTGHAATLRLDANGAIAQTAGSLTVGTLSASSNGAALGAITLNALGNDVAALGNVTVGNGDGDFSLTDAAPVLILPAAATVYADNVTISNAGSVVIAGNLAATTGTLTITTGAGDIVVEAPALIGAATGVNFGATGAFTQTGGVIDAQDIGISASNGDVTQTGGTIFAAAFDPAPGGLSVLGSGGFTQSAGAVLASDGNLYIDMSGSVSLAGSVLAFGPATVSAGTSLTSSGLVAVEGNLSLTGTGSLTQSGGTIASGGSLTLASSGAVSQTAGTAYGATVSLSGATVAGGFQSFGGALGVTAGANTIAAVTTGAVTPGAAAGPATSMALPALATGAPATLNHLLIDIEDAANPAAGSYTFTAPLVADWVELHTSGALTEGAGGVIDATLYSGSAGMQGPGFATAYTNAGTTVVSGASLTNANTIAALGSFTATGPVALTDAPGIALAVVGAVQAGAGGVGGQTLALTADSLTVDGSGTPVTVYAGQTIVSAGSLLADAAIAGGTIRPGQIQLITDNLALTPGGTVLVSAPNGSVAIAPRGATVIALGGVSSAGTLGLSNALLNDITTLGTSTGPAGTETLLIGSLDGATPAVGAIDINSGIVLGTVARTLDLAASGTVAEFTGGSLSVTALVGTAAAFALDIGANAIAELGNATVRAQGGALYQTSGFGAQTSLVAGGDIRLNDTASLTVVGPVTAGLSVQPDTLELIAPSIDIVTGPTVVLGTGTIAAAGALLANGAIAGGTLNAGLIALQADALSIQSTTAAGVPVPIVVAPGGMVAIAPYTAGAAMSIDATAGSTAGTLSVAASSLGFVSTFGTLAVPGVAPVGAQTLVLGSTDGGATQRAGSIAFTTPLDLRNTATTLALFTSGTVSQAIGAGITVGALVGQAGDHTHGLSAIVLTGPNEIAALGAATGATTALNAPVALSTDNLGAAGTLIVNVATVLGGGDLLIPAGRTVAAGQQSVAQLEIDVAGSLLVAGSVLADNGNAYLDAGNGSIAGDVTIAAGGAAMADGVLGSNPVLEISAGMSFAPARFGFTYGPGAASGSIVIDGLASAYTPAQLGEPPSGTIGLYAKNDILEPGPAGTGTVLADILTGSAGGTAQLIGAGTPPVNRIGTLAGFSTGNGLVLRDGTALTVTGTVRDFGPGVTLAVAPAGTLVAGYGIGDLAVGGIIDAAGAAGVVKLEATGNVYETAGGTIVTPSLIAQAGAIPDTEAVAQANVPGTVPASPVALASVWLDNPNQVGALSAGTATQNFTLLNGQDLLIPVGATVLAGAVTSTSGALPPAGYLGLILGVTMPTVATADIETVRTGTAASGNLTVDGTVISGLADATEGDVVLGAGSDTIPGAVTIGGLVQAVLLGNVTVSAGYNPALASYDTGCGPTACDIIITGTINGFVPSIPPNVALQVQLNAASSIDESTGFIGAGQLVGGAGGFADLSGGASGNVVGQVAFFDSSLIYNLASSHLGYGAASWGFFLRDANALTVGSVTDHGTASGAGTSAGVSIAVIGGSNDLTLQDKVVANATAGTVKLQATGNVYETSGGSISAGTLIAQSGLTPDTESGGNTPGTTPTAGASISRGAIWLPGANTIGTLAAATAMGNLLLNDIQALILPAGDTVLAGAGDSGVAAAAAIPGVTQPATDTAEIDAAGQALTIAGLLHAGIDGTQTGNVVLNAGASGAGVVTVSGTALAAAGGAVAITAGTSIAVPGTVASETGGAAGALVQVASGGGVSVPGAVLAASSGTVSITAGTSITIPGTVASEAGDGALSAVQLTGGTGVNIPGSVLAANAGSVAITAGTSVAITGRIAGQAGGEPAARITLSTGGTGQISANGVLAASGALSLTSGTGGIALGSGAVLTGTPITLNGGGGAITLGGNAVLGEAGATVDLVAGAGGISEAGTSQIVAATLLGDTGGAASLTGTNAIATLAGFPAARGDASTIGVNASEFLPGFTAAGGLTLDDDRDLSVAGPVFAGPAAQITVAGALTLSGPLTAGTVNLTAASLSLDGTLTGTTKVVLTIGGAVSETGALDTPILTGSSGGATSLTSGGNRIGAIDTYTAGSVLNVVDGEALTLAGVINAPTMVFDATPNQITIANGTTIVTGGTSRPNGPAGSFAYPLSTTARPDTPGAYFSDFLQQGAVTVRSQAGGPSIVRIDAYDGGNITFSPGAGLYGTSTWLILDLHSSGALGTASGNVFVRWLDVIFPVGSAGGGAALGGTVDGIGGQSAAGAADISPVADARYRFNSCAIGSVNCIVLPVEVLPLANPLEGFSLGSLFDSDEDDDLFLPLVSRRDY